VGIMHCRRGGGVIKEGRRKLGRNCKGGREEGELEGEDERDRWQWPHNEDIGPRDELTLYG
jgi:hypothetical protein